MSETSLPAVPTTPAARQRAATRLAALAGKRILIIEDEALLAVELEMCLEAHGAQVTGLHTTLARALSAAMRSTVDGAVVDVALRGQTTFEAAHILKERDIPFLFNTGYSGWPEMELIFPDITVCGKPKTSEELVQILADVIAEHERGASKPLCDAG